MRIFRSFSLALVLVLAAPALLHAQAQTEAQTTPRTMERENDMDWFKSVATHPFYRLEQSGESFLRRRLTA